MTTKKVIPETKKKKTKQGESDEVVKISQEQSEQAQEQSKEGAPQKADKTPAQKEEEIQPLNEEQAKILADLVAEYTDAMETLAKLEEAHDEAMTTKAEVFHRRALVIHKIIQGKLYAGSHTSAEAYFAEKWKIARSHVYRLAKAGEIIARYEVSPTGDTEPPPFADIVKLLATESHFRPLAKLTVEQRDAVLSVINKWVGWGEYLDVNPRMVEAAVLVTNPPAAPSDTDEKKSKIIKEFEESVKAIVATVPKDTEPSVLGAIDQIVKRAKTLTGPRRTTGISWTDATWNPLQGCSKGSCECDNCYAAQLVGTRLAGVYPGLVNEVTGKDGKKHYVFNGTIKLLPDRLGEPLQDRTPKSYFVNSMSDLFHKNVPEEFIEAVFEVMEKATWHTFQVLTKRPERMAKFTAKRYAEKEPPKHIWLGTSTGNQKAFDDRYPHLLNVKAAVRWLSIEPLIGEIKFGSLDGIDWVVVGGESGKCARKMEKEWVTPIRDACRRDGVAFYFKQWGEYGEDGKKLKGTQPMHPPLDGVEYADYPKVDAVLNEDACPPDEGAAPVADDADTKQRQAA